MTMMYYSTNKNTPAVTLKEAVVKGLAADNGLFMPEKIKKFDKAFLYLCLATIHINCITQYLKSIKTYSDW